LETICFLLIRAPYHPSSFLPNIRSLLVFSVRNRTHTQHQSTSRSQSQSRNRNLTGITRNLSLHRSLSLNRSRTISSRLPITSLRSPRLNAEHRDRMAMPLAQGER
jgi:hypothetical protein